MDIDARHARISEEREEGRSTNGRVARNANDMMSPTAGVSPTRSQAGKYRKIGE